MNSEMKVAKIWARPGIIILCAACLVLGFALACLIVLHSAEKRLAEEHAARMQAEAEVKTASVLMAQARDALAAAGQAVENCRTANSKNLSDSVDRLRTRTLLITSQTETPQGAQASPFPMMQRAGLLGLLVDVAQAVQKQTNRSPQLAQVWIVPTSIEPMFAGDADHAWVIHADLTTGRSVDAPHHPAPVTAVAK
jgi:hypothetical protein